MFFAIYQLIFSSILIGFYVNCVTHILVKSMVS